LIKNIHKFGKLPGIDVAFTIRQNGQYSTYQSVDRADFPPSKKQLVSDLRVRWTNQANLSQMFLYPVPKILLPHNIEAQIQQRSGKKPQLDLSKIESEEKDLNRNGSITRVENSSGENAHILPAIE